MTLYTYNCPDHGEFRCALRADTTTCHINMACNHRARRVWGFSVAASFQPHFNPTLGVGVSSKSQFESELSRAAELASQPTVNYLADGTPVTVERPQHNYVPVDMHDKTSLGVTNEGLDATYDRWKALGKDDDAKKLKKLMDD